MAPMETSPTPPATAPRGQRPGYACDECRRRKLRCDGRQPQCSLCQTTGAVCEVTQRGLRGPKKGYLKALKNRVVQLEALLESRLRTQQRQEAQDEQQDEQVQQVQSQEAQQAPRKQQQQQQHQQHQQEHGVLMENTSNDDGITMSMDPGPPVASPAPMALRATPVAPRPMTPVLPTPPMEYVDVIASEAPAFDLNQLQLSAADFTVSDQDMLLSSGSFMADLDTLHDDVSASLLPLPNTQVHMTGVLQAELDQLYFDRVHPSIPILHQRRYLAWSRSKVKRPSRDCLQHAMWTLAALLSAEYRDMVDSLYGATKQMLEAHGVESSASDGSDTEIVLSWVLVALCESMRTRYRESWMNAGRAIRMVQGLRFHEIDSPRSSNDRRLSESAPAPPESEDFTETEQRRRVFWMAYFLDHLLSIRHDWPVTLHEHVICTRLPVPDLEFQTGQQVLGNFLSEAITEPNPRIRSPFNECLITVTICGRILLRGQQRKISRAYGDISLDSAEQRWWLDGILTTRLQVLSQCYPPPSEAYEPMLLFAQVLAPATVVYYCNSMIESLGSRGDQTEPDEQVLEYQRRALDATATITRLAKALSELHFSRVHPLTPIPLFICAEFLYADRKTEPFGSQLKELAQALSQLKNVNKLEQSYLDLLPHSCVSKLTELAA
ncbi:hypothetical protein KVR01_012629 [Diaporthe batatas]|uniref:uncharacterized protein n=1 Tax=Diaporthe batatas TaxID=748121 RepID=UPI001D04AC89|nr:uncharacterized protein KVR01_012629 [Diaporthe batatas]KAG8157587.1 hypothetical protein KVR01_012629 [Diaporthe batatas]